jgi:hypothetical protein
VTSRELWAVALRRAEALASRDIIPGTTTSWDDVAVRGILAVAIAGCAIRDSRPAEQVTWPTVLAALLTDDRLQESAARAVASDVDPLPPQEWMIPGGGDSTPSLQWRWLTRRWDPEASHQRWDGLPRAIARGLPDPAIQVCHGWAVNAVSRAVEEERGALPRRQPVQILHGDLAGARGWVEGPSWYVDTAGELAAGPPQSYLLSITMSTGGVEPRTMAVADFVIAS